MRKNKNIPNFFLYTSSRETTKYNDLRIVGMYHEEKKTSKIGDS